MFPQLGQVAIDHAWSGLMSYARHKMPQIGRDPDGVEAAGAEQRAVDRGAGAAHLEAIEKRLAVSGE